MISLLKILKETYPPETKEQRNKRWIEGNKIPVDEKGRVILYHGTPKKNVKLIKQNGFKEGTMFADDYASAEHYAKRDRELSAKSIYVFKVHLPLDSFRVSAGIFAIADKNIEYNITQ